ncbi:hypothetical protein JCM10212_005807 [Sporobolomyces blumeae]
MRRSLALAITLSLSSIVVDAAIVPTFPGGGQDVFIAGQNCSFAWTPDAEGVWKSFDVDLRSGSNLEMTNVTRIVSGLDGTSQTMTTYPFPCPEVEPPAPIYFYEFSQGDEDRSWTSRFAIAAPNGTVIAPANAQQPSGEPIPWGVGYLVNGSSYPPPSPPSTNVPNSLIDEGLDLIIGHANGTINGTVTSTTATPTSNAAIETSDWWAKPTFVGAPTDWAEDPASPTTTSSVQYNITGFMQGEKCDKENPCGEDAPCCSEYGFCGSGRNCLAGCNPLASFEPAVCVPVPACVDQDYSLHTWSANRFLSNSSTWNGDASQIEWLVDSIGNPALGPLTANSTTGDSSLTLSLTKENNGTSITSTRSTLYGNVTARIGTADSAGIVTSFGLVSGVQDAVAFDFTSNVSTLANTSYFSQGEAGQGPAPIPYTVTNESPNFHDYTISWLPDRIIWVADGNVVRTLSRNETAVLDHDGVFRYPQTPSRIRFSISTAAQPDVGPDTAPAAVDFTSAEYVEKGYFSSYVSAISVLCYPTSLIPNFTISTNSTSTAVNSFSESPNATALTILPLSSDVATSTPTLTGEPSIGTDSLDPTPLDPAAANQGEGSSSTTVWWTPPTATAIPATASQDGATVTTTAAQVWWTPAVRRLRRWIQLEKVKRDEPTLSSYSYEAIDANGQVQVTGGTGSTTIASDLATGLNQLAAAPAGETTPLSTSTSDDGEPATAGQDGEDDAGKSRLQKWQDLGTAAHVGIIGGAALVGLLLVVIVATYAPIGDQGDFEEPLVKPYSTANRTAYDAPSMVPPQMAQASTMLPQQQQGVALPQVQPRRSASTASTASASSRYTNGGYVPSSSLRDQYFPQA